MPLYSYSEQNPTSDSDTVRMLLQDTDCSVMTGQRPDWTFYLTDGEIDRALSLRSSDHYAAAALCCLMMASSDLCRNKAVHLGQFSTTNDAAEHWRKQAAEFARLASIEAGAQTAEIAWDEFALT
jgi:hypothetical protein